MTNLKKNIVVFGATSAMAQATLKLYAQDQSNILLVGRESAQLETIKLDLLARGAERVQDLICDSERLGCEPQAVLQEILTKFGDFDLCLLAYGYLGDQTTAELVPSEAMKIMQVNYVSAVSILLVIGNYFKHLKRGAIVGISSVAGDRGRKSNYIYGSAKAGFSTFLEGMRQSLFKEGVHVLTIKPGFVRSPMTRHLKDNFLFVNPEVIGQGIYDGVLKKKDVLYLPWFWYWILLLVRLIPVKIFKKM